MAKALILSAARKLMLLILQLFKVFNREKQRLFL